MRSRGSGAHSNILSSLRDLYVVTTLLRPPMFLMLTVLFLQSTNANMPTSEEESSPGPSVATTNNAESMESEDPQMEAEHELRHHQENPFVSREPMHHRMPQRVVHSNPHQHHQQHPQHLQHQMHQQQNPHHHHQQQHHYIAHPAQQQVSVFNPFSMTSFLAGQMDAFSFNIVFSRWQNKGCGGIGATP